MTNTKLFLLFGTSLSLIPNLTSAQCVATQDCATLGYTENSCSGGNGVKCPFGNKWACFKSDSDYEKEFCNEYGFTLTCTGTGETGGVGKACNGKYNYCACADGYVWQNGTCKQSTPDYSNCVIGALFYSDNTCSDKLESSKTLLGVVIYEKTISQNGWIMTIKPIATGIAWGPTGTTGITDKAASASCTNTQGLVVLGSNYEAANKANSYKPTGTPSGKSWCLPSYDLLNNINNSVNFSKINAGITTAGGTILGKVYNNGSYYYEYVWSSSEYTNNRAWNFYASTSGSFRMTYNYKDGNYYYYSVRPVMEFQVFIVAGEQKVYE